MVSVITQTKKGKFLGLYFYEVPRIDILINTESIMVVTKSKGRKNEQLLSSGYRIFVGDNKSFVYS